MPYSKLVENVKGEKRTLGEFLGQGQLTRVDDESIELTYFGNGFAEQQIGRKDNRRIIEKHMLTVFGKALRLITTVDKSHAPESEIAKATPFEITPEELFQKNPELKAVADSIGGEIKSIKIIGNKGENDG